MSVRVRAIPITRQGEGGDTECGKPDTISSGHAPVVRAYIPVSPVEKLLTLVELVLEEGLAERVSDFLLTSVCALRPLLTVITMS